MNMNSIRFYLLVTAAVFCTGHHSAWCQETSEKAEENQVNLMEYPIAILPFKERGKNSGDDVLGKKVTDLMFAQMAIDPELHLVDREDLNAVLSEMELSLSGLTSSETAIKVGNLTGARILVTGSVFELDESIYVVGKIIGTETSRVVGASAKGPADGKKGELVEDLSKKIVQSIRSNASILGSAKEDFEDRLKELSASFAKKKLPVIFVDVAEQHIGRKTFDPAVETEIIMLLQRCGFTVLDSKAGKKSDTDLILSGEGISEYATRTKNLISVKSRLEIKLVDRESGKVVFTDRQTSLAVDLAENIAGKKALQDAAADITERLLKQLAVEK